MSPASSGKIPGMLLNLYAQDRPTKQNVSISGVEKPWAKSTLAFTWVPASPSRWASHPCSGGSRFCVAFPSYDLWGHLVYQTGRLGHTPFPAPPHRKTCIVWHDEEESSEESRGILASFYHHGAAWQLPICEAKNIHIYLLLTALRGGSGGSVSTSGSSSGLPHTSHSGVQAEGTPGSGACSSHGGSSQKGKQKGKCLLRLRMGTLISAHIPLPKTCCWLPVTYRIRSKSLRMPSILYWNQIYYNR